MSITFTNYPYYVPRTKYGELIERIVKDLAKCEGVVSIYQIGGIGNPGISDIDLLAVFEDNFEYEFNPISQLSNSDRYLFTHGLFGVSRKHFYEAQQYTFYHNYRLLHGEELSIGNAEISPADIKALKTQIALEYLVSNYIKKSIELTYRIVDVRSLLLAIKALDYDMQFLGISSGRLFELIQIIIDWRNRWFKNNVSKKELNNWVKEFYQEITHFMEIELTKHKFFLPQWAKLRYSRNICFVLSNKLGYSHKGIVLPYQFSKLGKKFFKFQHRFNWFKIYVPMTREINSSILDQRFLFLKNMKEYNIKHFKAFSPLTANFGHNVV